MKILFVLSEISGGGIATYYKNFIARLQEIGIESETIIPDAVSKKSDWPNNVSIPPTQYFEKYQNAFPQFNICPNISSSLVLAFGLFDYIKEKGTEFDVIEFTDYHFFYIPWLNELNRKYKIVVRHAGSMGQVLEAEDLKSVVYETNLLQFIERSYLQFADINIVLSNSNKVYWDVALNKPTTLIHPNVIPFITENNSMMSGGVVVGRVQKLKNPDVLCKALQLYKPKERINWIGGDTIYAERRMNYSLVLQERFPDIWNKSLVWLGKMSNSNVLKELETYKYLIIPSLFDTFNFSAIEGMLSEKIILCSSNVGMSDLIEDGVNGFIFENSNEKDLADKIKKIESLDIESLKRIGKNARETVVLKLANDNVTKRLSAIESVIINQHIPDAFLRRVVEPVVVNDEELFNRNVFFTMSFKKIVKLLMKKISNKIK